MQTRTTHYLHGSTINALSEARNGLTLRELAHRLAMPPNAAAMLSDVLRNKPGAVTLAAENDLRARLGLPPLEVRLARTCPSCGAVHGEGLDCHGQPVAAVVVLAPGQTVRRARKPPEKWADFTPAALRQALVNRQPLAATPRYYDRAGRCYTDWQEMGR